MLDVVGFFIRIAGVHLLGALYNRRSCVWNYILN